MRSLIIVAALALPAAAQDMPGPFASFDIASEPVLADPHDLAFGPDGRLYVADKFGARIAVFDPETLELIEYLGEGYLAGAHDISFGADWRVAVSATGHGAVALYEGIGALDAPPATGVQAPGTEGALLHSNGFLYVTAGGAGLVAKFGRERLLGAVQGFPGAHDLAEAPDGSIWVAHNRARKLVRLSPDLEPLQEIGGAQYRFIGPRYMDITPEGLLVVADQEGHRVLLIDPLDGEDGRLLGVLGDGTPGMGPGKFDDPEGVAVDGARFYISDSDNNRIVRYVTVMN